MSEVTTGVAATPSGRRAAPTLLRPGLAMLGILLVAANLRASITAVGPLLGSVRDDLGLSSATVSTLISLPLLCFAAFSPFAPVAARRLGMERTLGMSLVVLAIGIVARSVPVTGALWLGTALLGMSIATLNVTLPVLVRRDFPDRAGQLTGAYSAVQAAVAAAAAGVAVPLAGIAPSGWRFAFGIWAGVAVVAFAVFAPRLRVQPRPAASTHHGSARQARSPWRSAIGWQVTVFMGAQSALFYTVLAWWPSIEQWQDYSAAQAGTHQSVLLLSGIAGALIVGQLLQRWHDDLRPVACLLAPLPVCAILGQVLVPELAIAWGVLFGLVTNGSFVLAMTLFSARTVDADQATRLSAMAQSVGYVLAATVPPLLGVLHDVTDSWNIPIAVLLAVAGVQIVFAVLASRPRTIT